MVIPMIGGLLWLAHAGRCVAGRRSTAALLLWLAGVPALCLADFLGYVFFVPPTAGSGMASIRPVDQIMLGNLFLGLGTWVVLLVLEPLVWLVAVRIGRAKQDYSTVVRQGPR